MPLVFGFYRWSRRDFDVSCCPSLHVLAMADIDEFGETSNWTGMLKSKDSRQHAAPAERVTAWPCEAWGKENEVVVQPIKEVRLR